MTSLRLLLLALAGLLVVSLRGADSAVRVTKDVAFLAPDRKEQLDVYQPANLAAGSRAPAVVWIHGGGWTGGTKNEARAQSIAADLVKAGYVVLSVDYRLGNGAWPTNLFDCKNAVRFLRANAAKYGALSNATGQVRVAWQIAPEPAPGALHLEWKESGGPTVAPTARRSFGSTVIERGISYELQGKVEFDLVPTGLEVGITVPLAKVMPTDKIPALSTDVIPPKP